MKRALIAATAYFLALFTLGFALGTIRTIFITPIFGELAATVVEVPFMLVAAFLGCRWSTRHWQIPRSGAVRWPMVLWFLALLFVVETLLGVMLLGRTATDQWATLTTSAGLLGLSAQIAAALFPLIIGPRDRAGIRIARSALPSHGSSPGNFAPRRKASVTTVRF